MKPTTRIPLVETFNFRPFGNPVIVEGVNGDTVIRRSGVLQNFLERNSNKRIYPRSIWERLFAEGSDFRNRLKSRAMVGLLEHPEDGATRLDRSPSHVMVDVRFPTAAEFTESRKSEDPSQHLQEGDIIGTYEVLDTHNGRDLAGLIKGRVPVGVSSRGDGTLREDGEGFVVNDDYNCETWDVVSCPSVIRAIPSRAEDYRHESTGQDLPKPAVVEAKQPEGVTAPKVEPVTVQPKPLQESKMSKLNEMRKLELDVTRLVTTPTKGLKPSQCSAIFESITSLQIEVQTLLNEDTTLAPLAQKIQKRLVEFEDDLDSEGEPDGDETLPPPAAGEGEAPATEEPVVDPAGESDELGDEAEIIGRAADKLREIGDEHGDEEAVSIADELAGIADTVEGDSEGLEDEAMPPIDEPVAESRKRAQRLYKRCVRLESLNTRLSQATANLMERHKLLREEFSTRVDLGEGDQSAKLEEALDAARSLAERYNRDMIDFGVLYMGVKQPAVLEAHREQLESCGTWKEFSKVSEQLIKRSAAKRPVNESRPGSTKPAPAIPTPAVPTPVVPVVEEIHPAVAMASRGRRSNLKG